MAGLKKLFRGRGKRWSAEPGELPWFDRPGAEALLERRVEREKLDEKQVKMLTQWLQEGYCVLDGLIDPGDIDSMLGDLEALWEAETPTEGLEVLGARLKEEDPMALAHAELLALGAERRRELRDLSPWRVHGFHRFSEGARAIYESARLMRATSLLLGRSSVRDSTINFMYGSRQALHQDTVVFHVFPPNF